MSLAYSLIIIYRVKFIKGEIENTKITYKNDLKIYQHFMELDLMFIDLSKEENFI